MVNVGGRSKGCSACRRRRVKCDLTQPVCLRCQRAGLDCDGPRQDLAFVEATIVPSRRKVEHSGSGASSHVSSPEAGPSATTQIEIGGQAGINVGSLTDVSVPNMETPSALQLMSLPSGLRDKPQEVYIMFTRKFIAEGGPVDLALRELQSRDITRLETSRTADCETAHLRAVLSFATIVFGAKNQQTSVTQQGYLNHGATLKHLNQALSRPDCHEFDEVIVSVTTLAMQEMLVPSGPKFFLNHMAGLEKLLDLRDPQLHCSPKTLSLYKCLRHMLLFAALSAGRASILAQPGWKRLLSQHCESDEEKQEQRLYDIVADCSVLIPERDKLRRVWDSDHQENTEEADSIQQRADQLVEQLRDWRERWLSDPNNSFTETSMYGTQAPPAMDYLREDTSHGVTDLVFSSISSASLFMLYNIACLHVLQINLSLPSDTHSSAKKEEYLAAAHASILDICRSMPYCLDEELHKELHAGPVAFWAAQVAGAVLKDDTSREGRVLKELLERKSGGGGSAIVWES
ncbi:hypothetical protein FB567DRAFT_217434 [Paraphoma chrysanthemicola]|uniref:Zn(2)-C6 fungal-type domain-containing protein n=1 Tax=Paraphoma chrysanthemicola TaxID=798071 RepID=A0A8K0QVN5_9PLEO|nr:hypothetical protein FB567DRAFT_217434 [Paraphoma chrysanthemicola]